MLLVLGLLAVLALCYYLWRRRRARAYRRIALARLSALQGQYQQEQDLRVYLNALNALLKSVALHAYPRRDVAALSGQQWVHFLNRSLNKEPTPDDGFQPEWVTAAYQAQLPAVDVEQIQRIASHWLKHHKVSS